MLGWLRPLYRIDFVDGRARLRHGSPPPGFVSGCDDIAQRFDIRRGSVCCVGRGAGARLRFSAGVPERARQPLRNIWSPPGPPAGPRPGQRAKL